MPVVLKIDSRRRVVYSSFYGRVTDEELLGHGATIASDPGFNRNFSEIVDFSAVDELVVSDTTLATMAGAQSLFSATVRHIVVAPAELAFQLANKFKMLAQKSRPNVIVVRTRAEAYRALEKSKD